MAGEQTNTREIVLNLLMEMEKGSSYSHRMIRDVLTKYDYLDNQDKAFLKRLSEGVIERRIELDYVLNQFSKTPVHKMKPLIRCILRMGCYQILYMDAVPDSAACNEAVKLTIKRKFVNLKGFVNGVLRTISREKEHISYPARDNLPGYLSIRYSMPEWIVNLWISEYGEALTEQMMEALLRVRPVTIRFSQNLTGEQVKELLTQILSKSVIVKKHSYDDRVYYLEQCDNLAQLPGFGEGAYTVQDISSVLAVKAAGIAAGDVVIDLCAAPGGKTVLAAELTGERGTVDSRDLTEYKANLIQENITRMKLSQVTVKVSDATVEDPQLFHKADVVIADVPCSGLGVIGKKQDIKYNVTKESLSLIVELQKQIITNAVKYVKKGGVLLYSTCTIHQEENERMATWICEMFPYQLESLKGCIPEELYGNTTEQGYLQLMPGVHDSDGFFFAKLRNVE